MARAVSGLYGGRDLGCRNDGSGRPGADAADHGVRALSRFAGTPPADGGIALGGEKQKPAIARAVGTNPKLLLLREPSAGLASGITRTLIATIARIRQSGVAIVLVEQNMEIARALGERCCMLMRAGSPGRARCGKQWNATKPSACILANMANVVQRL